jgi:V/A-type H+-transporting ATPase subunit E
MTGLEKLIEKILSDARADADAVLAKAKEESDAVRADYKAQAEALREARYEQAEKEKEAFVARSKSSFSMEKRNVLLQARSEMVDEAFAQARQEILAYSPERYREFLVSLLTAVLVQQLESERISREVYGENEEAAGGTYEVLLNAKDRAEHGTALLSGVRNSLIGRVGGEVMDTVRLAEDTAAIDGGLILRCGDISCNCSLTALFAQVRASLEGKVSALLFDAARG